MSSIHPDVMVVWRHKADPDQTNNVFNENNVTFINSPS